MLFLLLCQPLISYADYFDGKYILGASIISQQATITSDIDPTTSTSGKGIGIYLDQYYLQKFRFNSALNLIQYTHFNMIEVVQATDYLIPIEEEISLFMGLSLGLISQRFNGGQANNSTFSLLYGIQIGAIKYLSENRLIETGIRFRNVDLNTKINDAINSNINSLNEVYFSLLFMF